MDITTLARKARDASGFTEVETKRRELLRRETALERELEDIRGRLATASEHPLEAEAAVLLADNPADAPETADDLRRRWEKLEHHLSVVRHAQHRFEEAYQGALARYSRQLNDAVAEEHRRRALRVAVAALELREASRAEQELREAIAAEGARVGVPVALWRSVEQLETIDSWLTELDRQLPGLRAEAEKALRSRSRKERG